MKPITLPLSLLGLALFVPCTLPAAIIYAGTEVGGVGTSFLVENWSNPGITKNLDVDGNNAYGSSGYFQLRPVSPWNVGGGVFVFDAVGGGNNLGTSAGSYPTLASLPSFVSSYSGSAGTYVNFNGYSIYRGPDGSSLYRQGALSVSVNGGPYGSPGSATSYYGTTFSFTLGQAASFRLGLAVDSVGDGTYAPQYVSVFNTNTGTIFSTSLTRNATPDLALFDIAGVAGDQYIVALWQDNAPGTAAMSLVTFDAVPEPAVGVAMLLTPALAGCLRRRRGAA